jgi:chaperonin cofactor prefoldin
MDKYKTPELQQKLQEIQNKEAELNKTVAKSQEREQELKEIESTISS